MVQAWQSNWGDWEALAGAAWGAPALPVHGQW